MKRFTSLIFSFVLLNFLFTVSINAAQFEKTWEFELNYSDPLNTVQSQQRISR